MIVEYKTITREQFLFNEMRIVAGLLLQNKNDKEIFEEIEKDNLFQYPTNTSIRNITSVCLRRYHNVEDTRVLEVVSKGSPLEARQMCLFLMIEYYKLVRDFMVGVVGDKYSSHDYTFVRRDINSFFSRLQEQNDAIASWSEGTIGKCKQVLMKLLVDNEYLDSLKSEKLNFIYLSNVNKEIISDIDKSALCAFNCFE